MGLNFRNESEVGVVHNLYEFLESVTGGHLLCSGPLIHWTRQPLHQLSLRE